MTQRIDMAHVIHELRNAMVPAAIQLLRPRPDMDLVKVAVTRVLELAAALAAQERDA